MMSDRSKLLADRLREVVFNGKWVANTNYRDQLVNTSLQQANQKAGKLNTIAALVYHIDYYFNGLNRVFESGRLEISDQFSFDHAPVADEEGWNSRKDAFFANAESFAAHVEQMTDEELDSPFVNPKYGTWLRNIEGVIEHCYYHLGQISLIRKLIT